MNNVCTYSKREILLTLVLDIQRRYDDFVDKGSGWSFESFKYLDLHITQTNDLRGGCDNTITNNAELLL